MIKRRDFMKAAALSTGALSLPWFGTKASASEEKRITNYAVIGLGFFSSYVIPRVQKSKYSRIKALVSSDKEKAQDWCKKYGLKNCQIYSYDTMHELAENSDIDAVYIATPVGTHAAFALKAFESGKHVLTEKTMAASVLEGETMIKASKAAGKKLMVAYRARYEPFNKKAIEFSRQHTYGKVNAIAAHKGFFIGNRLGKNNWRSSQKLSGGGALTDIGIYSIQACRYIAGAEPIEAFAFSYSTPDDPRFTDVEENFSFMLKFPDGLLATGSASWNYALQNYYKVGATKASFELNPATSNGTLRMFINKMKPREIIEKMLRNTDQIAAEFDHFSQCITEDKEPLTNGEEALKDLKVIEALYRSAQLNQPVRL